MPYLRASFLISPLIATAVLGLAAPVASAEDAADATSADVTELDALVVTATRTATPVYEALSGSSAIDADRLRRDYAAAPVTKILNGMPGVSTQTSADDPGIAVNLRGLQDFGRVNVMIDGARQNFQKNGHEANGTFYIDPEMMKSVDVTRGPVSSVYGSGAIGGVVNFTTIDADDLIEPGETQGARLRTSWATNGEGPTVNLVGATMLGENADALLGGTFRDVNNFTAGNGDTVQSAQTLRSGLAKFRWRPVEGQELKFSASRYDTSFRNGSLVYYDTDATVDTFTLGYHYTQPGNDFWDLTANAYSTRTEFAQDESGGSRKTYAVRTTGFDLFNTARFQTGAVDHELTFGVDGFRDQVHTDDPEGSSDDLTPSGTRTAWGGYVQNDARFGLWEAIGALRYDAYKLEGDDIKVDGDRLSPKLTIGVTPWDAVTFYVTYAEGYRAPAVTETLIDGLHPGFNGKMIPNPDLRPEVAHTTEAGVNLRFNDVFALNDSLKIKADVFENNVDDYIDQTTVRSKLTYAYQYQNVAKARIRGVELEGSYEADRFFGGLSGQILDSEDLSTGDELQKVPPWRIVATGGVYAFDRALSMGARATLVGATDDANGAGFSGDKYQTLDLFAAYRFSDRVSGDLALNNVFDRDYTQYLDGDPSPGFNATASLTIRF